MNLVRSKHADKLVDRAKRHVILGETRVAWALLEDAHIVAQPDVMMHVLVHWEMLRLACRERDLREILGQTIRLFLAAPASLFGRYPVGNTGRSNKGLFQREALSKKMKKDLERFEALERERIAAGGVLEKRERQHPLNRN